MTQHIILNRRIVEDRWQFVAAGAEVPADGDLIVPLVTWLASREAITTRAGRTGVWLGPADDPAALAGDFDRLPLIAVQFPQFTDGRGYSTARLLRTRFGFGGELRAFGDVWQDQVFYLSRVGFNAFVIKAGKSLEGALNALDDFSEAYQSSAAQPVPLYRRRLAA